MRALFKVSRKFCVICFFQVHQYDEFLKFDIPMIFEPFITNHLCIALIAVSNWTTGEKVVDPCAIQWMLCENIEISPTDKLVMIGCSK